MKLTDNPLLDFLWNFPPPATTAELWAEIALIRGWAKAADLPHTHEQLADELRLLAIAGRVVREGELWRPVAKVERREPQRSLFA